MEATRLQPVDSTHVVAVWRWHQACWAMSTLRVGARALRRALPPPNCSADGARAQWEPKCWPTAETVHRMRQALGSASQLSLGCHSYCSELGLLLPRDDFIEVVIRSSGAPSLDGWSVAEAIALAKFCPFLIVELRDLFRRTMLETQFAMDRDLQAAIAMLRVVGIPKRDPAESRRMILLLFSSVLGSVAVSSCLPHSIPIDRGASKA